MSTVRWGVARKDMEKNYDHFIQKGQTELPFVEQQYKLLADKSGTDAARSYLTEYTADFAGATILRWDEMTRKFWNDNRFGF